MRPVRLTLEGFRSHRDRTVLDFEGRSLVGIVGPNGSGKSSLLDGVAYALYGRTPSEGKGGKKLINARADAAHVELWFRTAGGVFRVTRLQRHKGTTQQALERWDGVDGTKLETIADKKAEIGDAIERLIGLDFDAFARSALLAQNRFADLLTAPPAEAAKVLTGLFGFGVIEEMRRIASQRLGEAQAQLLQVQQAETSLADVREKATDAAARAGEADATRSALVDLVGAVAVHDEAIGECDQELARLAEQEQRLVEAVGHLPSPGERKEVLTGAGEHAVRVAEATERVASARGAAGEAKEAVDAALGTDLPGAISRLASAIERASEMQRRRGEAERSRSAADQERARASVRAEQTAAAVTAATEALESARSVAHDAATRLAALEKDHAAHVLAEDLGPGDACPVCARPVDEVPGISPPEGLEAARTAVAEADEALRGAEETAARSATDAGRASAESEAAEERVTTAGTAAEEAIAADAAAGDLVESCIAAVEVVGAGPLDALSAARSRWEVVQQASTDATNALLAAEAALAALSEADPVAGVVELVDRARPAAALVGVEAPRGTDAANVEQFLIDLDLAVDAAGDARSNSKDQAVVRREAAMAARGAVLVDGGLAEDADLSSDVVAAGEVLAAARAEERLLLERVEELERSLGTAQETAAAAVRLARLQGDLAPGRFPQYLLDERRRGLADHGSEHLEVLSGGRYRFALRENQFKVRDLSAAGVVRDADTLSGGELFLASLALALGLATLVGLDRDTLEAFFIDEGFGSLDDDSLELAMDGLERMAAEGDRLVVVVSHVPEMRERLADLVELAKDPLTNDTVVIRG